MSQTASELRVAFYVYPTAFQNPGGGEIQLLKTKEALEKLSLPIRLLDPWKDKLSDYHILHTFGSVKDALPMMEAAKKVGVRNVLSTICWYSWKSSWHTYPDIKTKCLNTARHAGKVFFPWIPSERKRMMEISDLLLPNSESESVQLQRFFQVPKNKIQVVENAVDPSFKGATPDAFIQKFGLKDFVLIAGRIEPRKNQLAMVRALSHESIPVVIIGDYVSHYKTYYDQCRREAGKNIHFLGHLSHESGLLKSAYAACNTFLLASWLETPGLAALEAGLAGAKIVITREGATREYFGDAAAYVDPCSIHEIRNVTLSVYKQPKAAALSSRIEQRYLWSQTAAKTLEAYQKLMFIRQ